MKDGYCRPVGLYDAFAVAHTENFFVIKMKNFII